MSESSNNRYLRPICCCPGCPHCAGSTPDQIRLRYTDADGEWFNPACWASNLPNFAVCLGGLYDCFNTAWSASTNETICLCDYLNCHEFLGTYYPEYETTGTCCWLFDQLDWCEWDPTKNLSTQPAWWRAYLAINGDTPTTRAEIASYIATCGFADAENVNQCTSDEGRLGITPLVCIGLLGVESEGLRRAIYGIRCTLNHTPSDRIECGGGLVALPDFTTHWWYAPDGTDGSPEWRCPQGEIPAVWPMDCNETYRLTLRTDWPGGCEVPGEEFYDYCPVNIPESFSACPLSSLRAELDQVRLEIEFTNPLSEFDPPAHCGNVSDSPYDPN